MELKQARQAIDSVDEQLTELFCQRMRIAAQIAAIKRRDDLPLLHEAREQEILEHVSEQAGAELAPYARELYSALFTLSKDYQRRLTQTPQENIVLIGMPGCGKSSVGRALAELTGRELFDTDEMVIKAAGIGIPAIFDQFGEAAFRKLEQQAVARAAQSSGSVIATGGGTVLTEENRRLLGQNGRFYFIERGLDKLPQDGRPLSVDLAALYAQRLPIYQALAQATIDNNDTVTTAARHVLQAHKGC